MNDDFPTNGKSFSDMMREAQERQPIPDPMAPPTDATIIALSDGILEYLACEPLSPWQRQCVLATTMMRVFTGVPAKFRAGMMLNILEELANKIEGLGSATLHGATIPDISEAGTLAARP